MRFGRWMKHPTHLREVERRRDFPGRTTVGLSSGSESDLVQQKAPSGLVIKARAGNTVASVPIKRLFHHVYIMCLFEIHVHHVTVHEHIIKSREGACMHTTTCEAFLLTV